MSLCLTCLLEVGHFSELSRVAIDFSFGVAYCIKVISQSISYDTSKCDYLQVSRVTVDVSLCSCILNTRECCLKL